MKTNRFDTRKALLAAALTLLAVPASAATITVTTLSDVVGVDGAVSLREAVQSLNDGASVNADVVPADLAYGVKDQVHFADGLAGDLHLNDEIAITRTLAIKSFAQTSAITIWGGPHKRLFHAAPDTDLSISKVTLAGGFVAGQPGEVAEGGAILAGGLTLTDCYVFGHVVYGASSYEDALGGEARGGAISAVAVTLERTRIESSAIVAGQGQAFAGPAYGGAVYAAEVHISDSVFGENGIVTYGQSPESDFDHLGGGLAIVGEQPSTIERSGFFGNLCETCIGGGLGAMAPLTITNTTFGFNQGRFGGGLAALGVTDAVHLTVSKNSANFAHGVWFRGFAGSTAQIRASIVAGNVPSGDGKVGDETVFHKMIVTSTGYNLFGFAPVVTYEEGLFTAHPTDQIETGTPALVDADWNGGFTPTFALGATSTALDAIPAGDCTLFEDGRGEERPKGAGCDSGAYEAEPSSAPAALAGLTYYDANANGSHDTGEAGISGWSIDYTGTGGTATTATGTNGLFRVEVTPGAYTVRERASASAAWVQTGARSYSVNAVSGDSSGLDFGNLCLGKGGANGPGFWTTKNGEKLLASDDLAMLVARNLRKADGSVFDPASTSQLKSWFNSVTGTNMAAVLSSQLASLALDVHNGSVSATRLIRAAGTHSANAAGFATVAAVMAEADAELGLHGSTPAGSPFRAYQETLKNALNAANSNTSFVQTSAASCPAPF